MDNKVKPIQPSERVFKKPDIPDEVFEEVNKLLQVDISIIRIEQDKLIKLLEDNHGLWRSNIYKENMLDFEPYYREVGWDVVYYKSPYYKTESSYWIFKS